MLNPMTTKFIFKKIELSMEDKKVIKENFNIPNIDSSNTLYIENINRNILVKILAFVAFILFLLISNCDFNLRHGLIDKLANLFILLSFSLRAYSISQTANKIAEKYPVMTNDVYAVYEKMISKNQENVSITLANNFHNLNSDFLFEKEKVPVNNQELH